MYQNSLWRPWALKCPWACLATAFKRSVREPLDDFLVLSVCVFVLRSFVRKIVPNIFMRKV